MSHFNITTINLLPGNPFTFTLTNVKQNTVSGFNRKDFLDKLVSLHTISTETELYTLIIDASRCLFGPKVSSWPGADIAVCDGTTTINVVLEAGKTKLKDFTKNSRGTWSWSHCCLAFGSIFREIWYTSNKALVDAIPGCVNGYTSFSSTVPTFTIAEYNACVVAMTNWVTANKLTARSEDDARKVLTAVTQTIDKRTIETNIAFSFK